jgi:anti-anti-sigma regulatory factor
VDVPTTPVAAPALEAKPAPLFALASHCTVKDAAALKAQLLTVAEVDADLTVDVSAVERIDTSTMQLLCALVHDRALRIQRVVFKGESQSWREAVRLLGVAQCLGLPGYQEGTRA